jgi:hypothetical protein
MSLRVVGAGLGRTGTTSHLIGSSADPATTCWKCGSDRRIRTRGVTHMKGGRRPGRTSPSDIEQPWTDWPSTPLWSEIGAAFPDALIVLSVRDADAWWESASNTIFVALATYFADDAPDDGWTRMGRGMMTTFTKDWQDEASAKAAYLAHNELVRRTAPSDRFLEWHPQEGWEPICSALHLDVPDEPFPHTNTSAQARHEMGLDPM